MAYINAATMHFASIQCSKMRLRPGLRLEPRWGGSLQRSIRPSSWYYKGAAKFAAGRGKRGKGKAGMEREMEKREGRRREAKEGSWNRAAD